ncbi:mitochondrial inner membrane protein Mdm31, mitochondrion inheritance factor, interacts with ERMES [Schizosaccharomyces pombe]|uniref:Mitochondrial distribution and morphology protein 31 n=1 Tax=Schizosaccharomyces pombe (strain 972 / ATCC 24843) TaxID=284812 RepID=MDM31_SCHPO|nr:putative protein Mdm31 [Schizosaccharomyces pombe]Q10070.1 RecName: Full=Mitochondrial distribution and morphology protein 31; Flags: Precursor [Schizosaccharomyces pombe 972h-]CAA92257.1 mitochondrial inner membrane protein Mdm31 (predicted) [Schizosaccharomyces pombe]|eukprot:NP_593546.1 putative protein Mdm31 [Schizosaccharomyces pombe]
MLESRLAKNIARIVQARKPYLISYHVRASTQNALLKQTVLQSSSFKSFPTLPRLAARNISNSGILSRTTPVIIKQISMVRSYSSGDVENPEILNKNESNQSSGVKRAMPFRVLKKMKSFLFKQNKPLTVDNVTAFFSWWLVSHIVWIVVGTTTFFSLLLYTLNTVSAQELLGRWIGQLMTKNTGFQFVFESAIVPNWRKGLITFNKISVIRRPDTLNGIGAQNPNNKSDYEKEYMALRKRYDSNEEPDTEALSQGNYTQFELSIDKADVSFSFARFLNGKGIVKELQLKGVRGVVDRRFIEWDPSSDPRDYRRKHNWGDFEIEKFKLEDLRVTLLQPKGFRKFPVSVFFCELPRLRKQWLFYDLMNAKTLTGSFDNSMFTIHRLQLRPYSPYLKVGKQLDDMRHSRLRIDNVAIDHLNRGVSGAFGWINDGSVDFLVNISFPSEPSENSFQKAWISLMDKLKKKEKDEDVYKDVHFDVNVQLHNPKAVIPIFTNQVSYINNALIRPIIAYINSTRTFIPILCHVSKPLSDFDGSWTFYDSGVLQEISAQVYESFARDVLNQEIRRKRIQKVGYWSLRRFLHLVLVSLQELAPTTSSISNFE